MTTQSNLGRRLLGAIFLTTLLLAGKAALAKSFTVTVDPTGNFTYEPYNVSIQPGDTVTWNWGTTGHSVTAGTPGHPSGLFDSGVLKTGATFTYTFPGAGTYNYYCTPHGVCCGMVGIVTVAASTPTPTPSPSPSPSPSGSQLLNISTRMRVQTGDNVLIGGFIITGSDSKKILLRAIGPSLAGQGVANTLADPILELHGKDGSVITTNDNWKDTQQAEIEASGAAPGDDLESAIVATLAPDIYTAIVSGKNGTSGVGLVEAYDLDTAADSQLANISTRGFVETGDNVMIGGFILGNGADPANVLIRALGPSLTQQGVSNALADPTLELHDANGALVMSNDNWKDTQQTEIAATGIPPTNDLESAILVAIPPTAHTAIVSGKNGATGVALVEVYRLP
ncbi:MAG TPA: plastocyanin/azurin family copper-binding protein [Chthoniobacterales bacterium]